MQASKTKHFSTKIVAFLAFLILIIFAKNARSDVRFSLENYRNYSPVPTSQTVSQSFVSDRAGNTFGFRTILLNDKFACSLIRVSNNRAAEVVIDSKIKSKLSDAQMLQTFCIAILPDEKGGFFARGFLGKDQKNISDGFIIYFDHELKKRWIVFDENIVERNSSNGNSYIGKYIGPSPVMGYNSLSNQLVAFTLSHLSNSFVSQKPMTQLHTVDVETGDVGVSAISVSNIDSGNVQEVVPFKRDHTNGYLFRLEGIKNGSGALLFYDGGLIINKFDLKEVNLSGRQIINLFSFDNKYFIISKSITATFNLDKIKQELKENGKADEDPFYVSSFDHSGNLINDFSIPTFVRLAKNWQDVRIVRTLKVLINEPYILIIGFSSDNIAYGIAFKSDGTFAGYGKLDQFKGKLIIDEITTFISDHKNLRMIGYNIKNSSYYEYKVDIQDLPNYDRNILPSDIHDKIDDEYEKGCCSQVPVGYDAGSLLLAIFLLGICRIKNFSSLLQNRNN